jgi:hypothetical protein
LAPVVSEMITGTEMSWDEAVWRIVQEERALANGSR